MMRLITSAFIHDTIVSGDIERMRATVKQVEEFLSEVGDLSAALDSLKLEIARIERGR